MKGEYNYIFYKDSLKDLILSILYLSIIINKAIENLLSRKNSILFSVVSKVQ